MKIRKCFVSNSSSSSFILKFDDDTSIDKFATDLAKLCVSTAEFDSIDSADFIDSIEKNDELIVKYFARFYEMLFFGSLKYKTTLKDENGDEQTYDDKVSFVSIPNSEMWRFIYNNMDAEEILETAKASESGLCWLYPKVFMLTKNTVTVTENMIAAGMDIELSDKDKKLMERVKKGERLMYIKIAQGGDGTNSRRPYAFGGWDARSPEDIPYVEVLETYAG